MLQVTTRSSAQIVPPMKGGFWGLAFSPDGESVLYVFSSPTDDAALSLFRVPVLGGHCPASWWRTSTPRRRFRRMARRMAFIRRTLADGGSVIVLANADGTGERVLAKRDGDDPYTRLAPRVVSGRDA